MDLVTTGPEAGGVANRSTAVVVSELFRRAEHSVAARRESIIPKNAHDIITPQEAIDLVSEHVGVAILAKPASPGFHADGVVLRPLCDTSFVVRDLRNHES